MNKRKGEGNKPAKMRCLQIFTVLLIVGSGLFKPGTANECWTTNGGAFLDCKESWVKQIAAAASANYASRCKLVATCTNKCARHACSPSEDASEIQKFQCPSVPENPYCTSEDGGICDTLRADYSKAYFRVPPGIRIDEPPLTMRDTICSQNYLGSVFSKFSTADLFEYVYFGSIDGVLFVFPGRELNEQQCYNYDPRKRPWYIGAISMKKNVVILLDNGHSSSNQLDSSFLWQTSILEAEKNLTLEIFETLSPDDFVNVVSFKESGAYALLQKSVILVLTDGSFIESLTMTEIEEIAQNVNISNSTLFIYSFTSLSDDAEKKLIGLACNANGSYREIKNMENPLYEVRNYFRFLSSSHVAANKDPFWTPVYTSYDFNFPTIAVSYPVLDEDGDLIGVAGADIYVDMLGNLTEPVITALSSRSNMSSPNAEGAPMTCTPKDEAPCNTNSSINAYCPKSRNEISLQELSCCNGCTMFPHKSSNNIILVITIPIVVVIVLLTIFVMLYYKYCFTPPPNTTIIHHPSSVPIPGDTYRD
eukprot:c29167_g1_i3 orf=154-1758(-)